MSGGMQLALQATVGNGVSFDPFSLCQDGLAPPEVDVGGVGLSVDLRRFSREALGHSAAIFSNCAGLVNSRAEWRRTGL
jgi:hypothetical protein